MAGLWRKKGDGVGKYLVRRIADDSVLEHPNMVLGSRDMCAPAAINAYADAIPRFRYLGALGARNQFGYSVTRRDGTVPEWRGAVMHALDPCAPSALRAYAEAARSARLDAEYADDVHALASDFERYRLEFLDTTRFLDASSADIREALGSPSGLRDGVVRSADATLSDELRRGTAILLVQERSYIRDVRALAVEFEAFRVRYGSGDPDAPPHRKDDPSIIALMANGGSV